MITPKFLTINEIMKKYFYPAIFSKEGKSFNVKFIDFDDIFTYGTSFDDAYYMAQDALYNIDCKSQHLII